MYEFHQDKSSYFNIQFQTAGNYILPFVRDYIPQPSEARVLEIGCAHAGVLKAFTDDGYSCMGIELNADYLKLAEQFMADEVLDGKVRFMNKNIYDVDVAEDIGHKFDLIILKDVIEHIPQQEVFIPKLREFLNPGGKVFFGFPPWYMPFGGHQQICKGKLLSKLPWYHLLPKGMFKTMLELFGEPETVVRSLMEIKDTGISIQRFERIIKQNKYRVVSRKFFLFNPVYKYKFGLNVRKQFGPIAAVPVLRDFMTTAVYYMIGADEPAASN